MSRWKAAGSYLLICLLVACAVLALMLLVWFPWPLFDISGGGGLMFIVVSVDVVLGPLIVLIIYNPEKKSLKLDLAVIVLLQLSALGYGLYKVAQARPIYIVFTVDRFDVVTAKDLEPADLAKVTRDEFRRIPLGRPQYIAVETPADPQLRSQVLESAFAGRDLQMFPQYYVPYADKAAEILKRAQVITRIEQRAPQKLQDFLQDSGRSRESVRYLPVKAARGDAAVLIDAVTAQPLRTIVVDPW